MLPWAEMWRSAMSIGIAPVDFWTLSFKEWRWLSGGRCDSLKSERLQDLMKEYPDG